jgi:hypothetical protein
MDLNKTQYKVVVGEEAGNGQAASRGQEQSAPEGESSMTHPYNPSLLGSPVGPYLHPVSPQGLGFWLRLLGCLENNSQF